MKDWQDHMILSWPCRNTSKWGGIDLDLNWENRLSRMANNRIHGSIFSDLGAIEKKYKPVCLSIGEPATDFFPLEDMRVFFNAICDRRDLFGYYPYHAGFTALREWIVTWMHNDGIVPSWVTSQNIVLTNGSQQALSYISDLLVDEETCVAVEAPSYVEALRTFRRAGAKFVEIETDENGIIPESFENVCKEFNPSILYTIPNFQNPSGSVAPIDRRNTILDIANKYDVVIIEDDPYRYVSFVDSLPQTYIGLANENKRVIYLGSFSKLIAPGIRCGWMVLPSPIVGKMLELRNTIEMSLPAPMQFVVSEFCLNINIHSYLLKIQNYYKKRCNYLISSLDKYMVPSGLKINYPTGGLFVWSQMPGIKDDVDFVKYAIKNYGVSVMPGSIFYSKPGQGMDTLRFSFARIDEETAEEGCRRLALAYDNYIMDSEKIKNEERRSVIYE